jgi:deoxyadenosine kinase
MSKAKLHIALSGLIGAGKSTLCKALSETLGLPAYYEAVIENQYLEDFYQDQALYGFALQIHLLTARFRQQQQLIWSTEGGIQDRSIYEDPIFAKMLWKSGKLTTRDYHTYTALFSSMLNFMRRPDVIIHLDLTPEQSLERIRARGRPMEAGISLDYLRALHAGYEEFLQEISKITPVLRVPWASFRSAEEVAFELKQQLSSMQNMRMVRFSGGE